MRILKLTPALEKNLLRSRHERDREAEAIAAKIIADVRKRGDAALLAYTKRFDRVDLRRTDIFVAPSEISDACNQVSSKFRQALRHAARNIRKVAQKQLPQEWTTSLDHGITVSQLVRPIDSIGCYVPGGRFSLVSTLLMTVIPAQVVGVPRVTVVCPKPNAELLAAARLLGIPQIARVGGAQAIAALAYGTKSIARVDKIFGPGNRFVTAAKHLVSSDCAIDLPAGPTEAIVLASSGNPRFIAADLIAQAEHAPDAASFLVTTSQNFAQAVQGAIEKQLAQLAAGNPARVSARRSGAILVAPSLDAACEFIKCFAPEHFSLPSSRDYVRLNRVAAGTIFLGPLGAQPLGDYITGSNHVLPTGGWARTRGGLSTADFVRCTTVQTFMRRGFESLAPDAITLAHAEGLVAHASAVKIRMKRQTGVSR